MEKKLQIKKQLFLKIGEVKIEFEIFSEKFRKD